MRNLLLTVDDFHAIADTDDAMRRVLRFVTDEATDKAG